MNQRQLPGKYHNVLYSYIIRAEGVVIQTQPVLFGQVYLTAKRVIHQLLESELIDQAKCDQLIIQVRAYTNDIQFAQQLQPVEVQYVVDPYTILNQYAVGQHQSDQLSDSSCCTENTGASNRNRVTAAEKHERQLDRSRRWRQRNRENRINIANITGGVKP